MLVYFVTLVTARAVASGAVGMYFFVQGEAQRPGRPAAGEGGGGRVAHRSLRARDRAPDRLDCGCRRSARTKSLELRRFDYLKLLRQVPAITEVCQVEPNGREQVRVSRLGMDVRRAEKTVEGSQVHGARGRARPTSARCISARRPSPT